MLEPNNQALAAKLTRVRALRQAGRPTVPSTIAEERATNPFLRVDSPELAANVRRRNPAVGADEVAVFAAVRALKDQY